MKLARIKRVTAVARLRGRSTREARRVGAPTTDSVLASDTATAPPQSFIYRSPPKAGA